MKRYAATVALVGAATGLAEALQSGATTAASLMFLAVVLSSLLGRTPGLAAAVSGFLLLNLLFTPPRHSLVPEQRDDVVALAAFLVVAVAVGGLVARATRLRGEAERRGVEAREARLVVEVERARNAFLSAVTHNLRTPLAAIRTSASTLLSPEVQLSDSDRQDLLTTVYEETDRLGRLVDNVLEHARIQAGGIRPDLQPADLAGVAQVAAKRVAGLVGDRRICLDIADDLPVVDLDAEMTEQVLVNLLENALRYAPPRSDITVRASALAGGVALAVVDHGPGVPPAERDLIFDEFHRGRDGGTGLGLAIAQALAIVQAGTLSYEDTPGGGATFVARFVAAPSLRPEVAATE